MQYPQLPKNRLIDLIPYQLEHYPNPKAFSDKVTGKWRAYSTAEVKKIIDNVSLGLLKLGFNPNDKIAIISRNRVEWNFVDLGILQMGGIVVPLYPNTSEDNYSFIFQDADVKLVFVEDEELFDKVQRVNKKIKNKIQHIYTFNRIDKAHHWTEITEAADENLRKRLQEINDTITEENLATIIYTSGTTGIPKGVMLSHKNIISNVNSLVRCMPIKKFKTTISFLPLCHIFERTAVYFYMILGTSINYPQSLETVGENIREVKPDFFITVPRLLEKVFERIMDAGYKLSLPKKAIFGWAVNLANHYDHHGKNNWFYNLRLFFARKIVFTKWKEALGGNIKGIISGSAALQPRLSRIFIGAGIPVIEGYGLTETSPVLTCNRFNKKENLIGTVGIPIPDVEIKIGENGEILAKGPNVMIGYYNNPEATKEAIDEDGWLHTGDVGEIVEGKFLKITGRIKEMFKTSGGKFVVPQPIENKMKESFFIEQMMVIGENRKFVAAIIQPNFEFIRKWAKEKKMELITREQIAASPVVKERIWREVQKYNKRFGHVQQIKKIALVPDLWSVETGELTPTMKVKRDVLSEKYKNLIEEIYAENSSINLPKDE
ncbi:long-chain fatty acid--CoA ligase [Melioribacteraceae bacterium 4301-Me]|uniref:AMP-dependent synthetase/ligase n=1 Tax=Pyranulibacter aquaticus TaxID=3163344 RepID=UPI00359A8766